MSPRVHDDAHGALWRKSERKLTPCTVAPCATRSQRELPPDLAVTWTDGQRERLLRLDSNFVSSIALLHSEAEVEAQCVGTIGRFDVRVLTPTDLCVSKIGRWRGPDADDVTALARFGLLDAPAVERRAREAMDYFVGNLRPLEFNLSDALEIIRSARNAP